MEILLFWLLLAAGTFWFFPRVAKFLVGLTLVVFLVGTVALVGVGLYQKHQEQLAAQRSEELSQRLDPTPPVHPGQADADAVFGKGAQARQLTDAALSQRSVPVRQAKPNQARQRGPGASPRPTTATSPDEIDRLLQFYLPTPAAPTPSDDLQQRYFPGTAPAVRDTTTITSTPLPLTPARH